MQLVGAIIPFDFGMIPSIEGCGPQLIRPTALLWERRFDAAKTGVGRLEAPVASWRPSPN